MLHLQVYILPGMLLLLGGMLLHGRRLRRHPMMFAQATVVALTEKSASFRLFDGQILELSLGRDARLQVGDYGRLTYRDGRFLKLE